MTSSPNPLTRASSGAANHGVSPATSGADTANPISPPPERIAAAPADGYGVPAAMWIRPSAPTRSAVQPITIRPVCALRSGWRRNRQASRPSRRGSSHAADPNAPRMTIGHHPAEQVVHLPPGGGGHHDGGGQVGQPGPVPAVQRVHVPGTASRTPGRRSRPRARRPSRPPPAGRPASRTGSGSGPRSSAAAASPSACAPRARPLLAGPLLALALVRTGPAPASGSRCAPASRSCCASARRCPTGAADPCPRGPDQPRGPGRPLAGAAPARGRPGPPARGRAVP